MTYLRRAIGRGLPAACGPVPVTPNETPLIDKMLDPLPPKVNYAFA